MSKSHPNHTCSGFSGRQGNWSGRNIAAMVVGFVVFWPIGLVLLYWNITGRDVREFPGAVRGLWAKFRGREAEGFATEDNVVFNEYHQTQYDRIRDIKAEIEDRARRFKAFRADAKRRKDEEEFNRFMSSSPLAEPGSAGNG